MRRYRRERVVCDHDTRRRIRGQIVRSSGFDREVHRHVPSVVHRADEDDEAAPFR